MSTVPESVGNGHMVNQLSRKSIAGYKKSADSARLQLESERFFRGINPPAECVGRSQKSISRPAVPRSLVFQSQ